MIDFAGNFQLYIEWLISLIVSVLLSAIIGLEREKARRPAGFRTHVLVGMGACLVMLTGRYMTFAGNIADTTRMAAQVVSGIGFLGAGTIIKTKTDGNISGLTTAATLWLVAGIGLAAGAGFYWGATITALLAYASLILLKRMERLFKGRDYMTVRVPAHSDSLILIMKLMRENHCGISNIESEGEDEARVIVLESKVAPSKKEQIILAVSAFKDASFEIHCMEK